MRICIDTRWIFPELSGIGLYTQELLRALAEIDRENDYILLFDNPRVRDRTLALIGDSGFRFQVSVLRYGLFSVANQLRLPRLLQKLGVEVYHSTNYMMPLLWPCRAKRVVTIHDLIPLLFPDHAPKAKKARLFPLYKGLMRQVARRADLVIAVSESTKRDLVQTLDVPADRIAVTLEGVTPEHVPSAHRPPSTVRRILFVGRRDPYKNLPLLVEAFSHLASRISHLRLRVVGPDDPRYPEARAQASALGLNDRVDWVGYASDQDLLAEYQQADVFVLPSTYEGFGLTVLEAMACGAPVVCSRVSSLPEVVGEAGLLVTPGDPTALSEAVEQVLANPALAADLRARGLQRAAQFTWERCARATLAAYAQALTR